MSHSFYPGQEVVCIDDKVPLENGAIVKDAAITEGTVYRLRWVGMSTHYVFGDYLGVKLEGVDSRFGEAWGVKDAPFAARRFRPLVKDPLAWVKQIAADPHGYQVTGPEGPIKGAPDDGKRVKEKEEELV